MKKWLNEIFSNFEYMYALNFEKFKCCSFKDKLHNKTTYNYWVINGDLTSVINAIITQRILYIVI